MANVYAPKQFLRQAEAALLKEYFTGSHLLPGIEWDALDEKNVDPIYNAWVGLPVQFHDEIEQDFREIHKLASQQGIQTLIEEARFHEKEIASELERYKGHINKALWVFLNYSRIFGVASQLNWVDQCNKRYLRKRKNIAKKEPKVDAEALRRFAKSISSYFLQEQGKGRKCHVETYLRGSRFHYFFAYPQDHTDTFIGFDAEGNFKRSPQTPAFEVIFIYDPIDGTLELYVEGDKSLREELQRRFVGDILDDELTEEDPDTTTYGLNQLKDRHFSLRTEPGDHIKEVRIRELRFSLTGNWGQSITLSVPPKGSVDEIYQLVDKTFQEPHLPLSSVTVNSVTFQMRFEKSGSRARAKTLSFKVSHPDSCNLKDSPEELIAKKYLRLWKIETE